MNRSIKNAAAISATITRNSEEIRKMYSESYRKRSESQDRISRSSTEYVRGEETYKNPYEGRQIQLPSGYRDAWVNARGEYLLSNDGGFNPNMADTGDHGDDKSREGQAGQGRLRPDRIFSFSRTHSRHFFAP